MPTPSKRPQSHDYSPPEHFEGPRLVQPAAGGPARDESSEAFPTVIVASKNVELREWLTRCLSRGIDPLVLEADGEAAVLNFVKTHSRPIQVLLIDCTLECPGLAATVSSFRRHIQILRVGWNSDHDAPEALSPEAALAKAEEALAR